MSISIKINGTDKQVEENTTIKQLLEQQQITGPMFVVERNLEVVPKDKYDDIVKEGDILEIVGFFGGG